MKLGKTREMLIDEFQKCLSEEKLIWEKGWKVEKMYNPSSNLQYHGINQFFLSLVAHSRKYADNRWMTFNQIVAKEYKLNNAKGQGVPVEYWMCYNTKTKQSVSFQERDRLIREGEFKESDFRPYPKTYVVFNGSLIEGLPKVERNNLLIDSNDRALKVLENYLKNENVELISTLSDRACYIPALDKIEMPEVYYFKSREEYLSTLAHEISHSTGHEKRLDRNILNAFGTPDYAIEELRAEIASAFVNGELGIICDKEDMQNNKAYVQDWAEKINKDPNILFKAIQDAEKINDFVLEKGEFEKVYTDELTNEEIWRKFETILDDCDFELNFNSNEKCVQLIDRQGANLGNIEEDKFENAKDIIERLDIYIDDFYVRVIEDALNELEIDTSKMNYEELVTTSLNLIEENKMSKEYLGDISMLQFINDIPDYECLNNSEELFTHIQENHNLQNEKEEKEEKEEIEMAI